MTWMGGYDTVNAIVQSKRQDDTPQSHKQHNMTDAEKIRLHVFEQAKERWLRLKGDTQRLNIREFNMKHPELRSADLFLDPENIDEYLTVIKRGMDPTHPGEPLHYRQSAKTPDGHSVLIETPAVTPPVDTKWYEDRTTTNLPNTKHWYDWWDPAADIPGGTTPAPDVLGAWYDLVHKAGSPLKLFQGIAHALYTTFGYVVWDVQDLIRLLKGWDGTVKMLVMHPTYMFELIWRIFITGVMLVGGAEIGPILLLLTEWIKITAQVIMGVFHEGMYLVESVIGPKKRRTITE